MANFHNSVRYAPIQDMVGLIHIIRADGIEEVCTGSLIAADKILANAHCMHVSGQKRATSIVFNLHFLDPAQASDIRTFNASVKLLERCRYVRTLGTLPVNSLI